MRSPTARIERVQIWLDIRRGDAVAYNLNAFNTDCLLGPGRMGCILWHAAAAHERDIEVLLRKVAARKCLIETKVSPDEPISRHNFR
jgi:hypothetical protein